MNILTINAGSSSIKFKIFVIGKNSKLNLLLSGQIIDLLTKSPQLIMHNLIKNISLKEDLKLGSDPYAEAIKYLFAHKKFNQFNINIVINRVVHGGSEYKGITLLHPKALSHLALYNELAPLHQPYNLLIADFLMQRMPKSKHYACFDTAFHQTMPLINRVYAIPWQYTESGVKRYGFHGLSYQYLSSRLDAVIDNKLARQKWVMAHLGSGSSVCAIKNKKSVVTSMGFSVAEGIPMATRCGELDPQIPTYLMSKFKLTEIEVNDILYHKSGMLGLSNGLSSDMKTLSLSTDKQAKFAVEFYCLQVASYITKLATINGGMDGLVFSGGIGENSALIRAKIVENLAWLGLAISKKANSGNKIKIHKKNSKMPILIIPTDEELSMVNEFLLRSSL